MSKRALQAVIDQRPAVRNGELVHAATVVQVSQLALNGPYRGDFQIIDQGRLIVGEHPDLGERVIAGSYGMFGYDPSGVNTFAVVSRQYGPFGAGDVFAGYTSGNYLLFDQSEGTLGVYSPAGAGFIAAADGSLYAGDTDGAHMRWNTATRAIEVRNGEDVKISLDANGDASFDGTVYASGGRIYGQMQVDGLFRAGDVDGPSISLGRFERTNDLSELVESSEIIATDANNLPWFHVVAGGGTAAGGYFYLGNPGDYQQRLIYDGTRLALDGDIYARGGELGDLTLTGDLTITTGSLTMDTVTIDNSGITFDAILGKYDGGGLRWLKQSDSTERLRIGTMVDLGAVTGVVVESQLDDMTITAPNVYIQPIGGVVTFGAPDGGYGEVSSSYTTISETGSITTVGTATATFANGIIGPSWKPASDSTTALQLQNAAGSSILVVDTTNGTVGIGRQSYYEKLEVAGTSRSIVKLSVNGGGETGFVWQNEALGNVYANLIGAAGQVLSGSVAGEFIFNNRVGAIVFSADSGYTRKDLYVSAAGLTGIGNASPDSKLHVNLDDSATNAASQLLTLSHNTSGTVANGFGSRVLWELESSTTADQTAAAIDGWWIDKTHATRTGAISLYGSYAGTLEEGVRVDATSDGSRTKVGDPTAGNYTQFDHTGHLTFTGTAKPWNDILIEPSARTTGTNAPTFEKWYDDAGGTSRGVYLYSFDDATAGSEKEVFFTLQMSHAWDGGDIRFHVHWVGAVDDTTATPRWGLEYTWKEPGGVFGDTTIVYATGNHLSEADITANKHYITAFTALSPGSTADDLSSVLIGRLFRNSSNAADTYNATGAKCGLLYIDAHYQLARIGSNDEYTA